MDQKVSEVRRHRGRLSTEEALEIFKSPEIVEAALEGKAQIERGESVRLTLDDTGLGSPQLHALSPASRVDSRPRT